MGETRSGNKKLVKKKEANRPRSRWDNIRMNLIGIGCVDVDWIQLAQTGLQTRAFLNAVINFLVP
jgi:hypothetical protein